MARIEKIDNITDLLGFVYDPDTLPTAILKMDRLQVSVHALRAGEQGLIERLITEKLEEKIDEKNGKLSKVVEAYRFWDDFPNLDDTCWGCYYSTLIDEPYRFRNIEQWGTKTFEECA